MILLIPSFEPDEQLVELVSTLRSAGEALSIVVVNDGSDATYDPIFRTIASDGVTILRHSHNSGKGRALKTGFAHIATQFPGCDVVCADSDGQHRLHDILRVATALAGRQDTIVLGARGLVGKVPFKSRLGNAVTRVLFRFSTGTRVGDTQTGLRAYPASLLPWLQGIEGERFEYEMSVLLDAAKTGIAIREVPIDTVYLDGNSSTHFRPLIDSALVYVPLVKFSFASLAAFVIDLTLLFVFKPIVGHLLPAVVLARVFSSIANFAMNRFIVFRHHSQRGLGLSARRYFSLVAGVLIANYAVLHVLVEWCGLPLLAAKLLTEVGLFAAGFQIQKRVVFARRQSPHASVD